MFEGKVALVTGAGSKRGIGRGIAHCLARRGANLVINDVDEAAVNDAAGELVRHGVSALPVVADVSSPRDVERMVEKALARFGGLDILVNNAGISEPTRVLDMTEEQWERILSVNLTGTFLCSKAVLMPMMERRWGRIVSISSVAAHSGGGTFGGAHYVASKAGIIGFSRALAREVAQYGITVNVVSPGAIDTDITKGWVSRDGLTSEEYKEKRKKQVPVGRLGLPTDVGEAVAFLASEEASFITGAVIAVNGGVFMGG